MTLDEYRRLLASRQNKPNKYRNRKSGSHASRKEAARSAELHIMQMQGLISRLQEQVKYELIPPQKDPDGKIIERACNYIADFVYRDTDGNTVVEDTKGFRTPEYKIKRKLMLAVHGIRIKET